MGPPVCAFLGRLEPVTYHNGTKYLVTELTAYTDPVSPEEEPLAGCARHC